MGNFEKIQELSQEYSKLLSEKSSKDLLTTSDMESRIQILTNYNCVNKNLVVQLKGRVLGIFNNPYNLIITQALFEGVFIDIEPAEIAGLVSIFVTEEKNKKDELTPDLPLALKTGIDKVKALVNSLKEFEISKQINSEISDQDLRLTMVEIVYLWAQGRPFVEICDKTNIKEGNIVRGILRVHDLLRSISEAGVIMGDHSIKKAADLIQRDIVFATSLYISN